MHYHSHAIKIYLKNQTKLKYKTLISINLTDSTITAN